MHVLLVPSWYPAHPGDPAGSFFRDQALGLKRRGHQVGVIAPALIPIPKARRLREPLTRDEFDHGVATYRGRMLNVLPRVPYASPELFIQQGMRLFRRYVERHGRPDVMHAHSMLNGGLLAARIRREYGIPFVVTEHATGFARKTFRPWQLRIAARAASTAGARIAVSEPFVELLTDQLGGQWRYIPNIVAPEFTDSPLTCPPAGPFTVVNASFLTPKKDIAVLLEAFAQAFPTGDERLRIAGDGPERTALEARATQLGVRQRVEFLGQISHDQVVELMRSSHAYALSSTFETFGVVLIESLALGRPVVATRCGGPESIVEPGDGFLIDVGDTSAMAKSLRELRDSDQFVPAELRERCVSRFGVDAVLSQVEAAYCEALA